MDQLKASIATIEKWRKKSSELSTQRKDSLFTAASKGFNAMAVMMNKESNYEEIQHALGYLKFDASFSLEFDKLKDYPTREIMHGFLESLHLVCTRWAEDKKQAKEVEDILHQGDKNAITNSFVPMEPREETIDESQAIVDNNQIPSWDVGETEIKFNIKEEVMEDDPNVGMNDPENEVENQFNGQFSVTGNGPADVNMPPLDFANGDTTYNDKVFVVGDPNLDEEKEEEESLNDRSIRMDSDVDSVSRKKKSRSESAVRKDIKSKPAKEDDKSKSTDKESRVTKRNATALDCSECEYRTHSVDAWRHHLRMAHSTTPVLAGLVLRCECGHECFSNKYHYRTCYLANYTIIKRNNAMSHDRKDASFKESSARMENFEDHSAPVTKKLRPESAVNNDAKRSSGTEADQLESANNEPHESKRSDTAMKCPKCEYCTYSVDSWLKHLARDHPTTPVLAGLTLSSRCECGDESQSDKHSRECISASFTIICVKDQCDGRDSTATKLDEE